jgi:hypothetical protein
VATTQIKQISRQLVTWLSCQAITKHPVPSNTHCSCCKHTTNHAWSKQLSTQVQQPCCCCQVSAAAAAAAAVTVMMTTLENI